MESYVLTIKDKNGKYQYFSVAKEVYFYVRQLEAYIKHPKESKLKDFYFERFGD